MTDEIIQELWHNKDKIASEFDYNLDSFAEYILTKQESKPAESKRQKHQSSANEKKHLTASIIR